MGKPSGKKKTSGGKTSEQNSKPNKPAAPQPRAFDDDTAVFIEMAQELKEEGNRHFQRREYEAAVLTYEKAVKLLPKKHLDVAYLRSNLAACYMQMNPGDFHHAIKECNLALEVSPKYSKALLKRARCYEALNRLEWALKDVNMVLTAEPNNVTALDILERVKKGLERQGISLDNQSALPVPEPVSIREKEKSRKKRNLKAVDKAVVKEENLKTVVEVQNNSNHVEKEEPKKPVKLVLGEDIRWAELPHKCSILQLREIVRERFPNTKAVLIKYKDKEGDLMTITKEEELKWAEDSADPQGSFRLYVVEVNPEQDPLYDELMSRDMGSHQSGAVLENGYLNQNGERRSSHVEEWIVRFAQLFKNHVGFDSDEYMDLHELGMKLYSEAIEDTVTTEEAQDIFGVAEHKFQEMAALAMFNWGNVHMSRARKMLFVSEEASTDDILSQVKAAYEYAQREYVKAGKRYEEALRVKPDFYEGLLALGQQQFEQAKLSWYFAIGSKVDLDSWPSSEVLELFNNAEDNMERGTEMWEEIEEHRLKNLSRPDKEKDLLNRMGLGDLFRGMTNEEAAEQASNMRSQINLLWGTMLYERSIVEFKLEIPIWNECLIAAIEKFKLAGASPTDIAVMIKNHCSNETAQEGLGFKVDEIVQAWNEMYDGKRWQNGVPSFRLEPLFRRRVPKLHHTLEHLSYTSLES